MSNVSEISFIVVDSFVAAASIRDAESDVELSREFTDVSCLIRIIVMKFTTVRCDK